MTSQHSWSQLWKEQLLFEEAWQRHRKERPRMTSCLWPPIEDHRLYEKELWRELKTDLVTDRNGLIETQVELPDRWGTYDLFLVAVSQTRASAVWTETVRVGPISWTFEPPQVLWRGETRMIQLSCENISDARIDLKIQLDADGLQILGDTCIEVQLDPSEEIEVEYPVEVGYQSQAVFRWLLSVDGETRELKERAIVATKPYYEVAQR